MNGSETIAIWLDDERPPSDSTWTRVRDPRAVMRLFRAGRIHAASLDHDLAVVDDDGNEITGYTVVLDLVRAYYDGVATPPPAHPIRVHAANPVGASKMRAVLDRYLPETAVSADRLTPPSHAPPGARARARSG